MNLTAVFSILFRRPHLQNWYNPVCDLSDHGATCVLSQRTIAVDVNYPPPKSELDPLFSRGNVEFETISPSLLMSGT